MLYIIREKKSQNLCYEAVIDDDLEVKVKQVYPAFDGRTMEMGYWTGSRETLPEPFMIDKDKAIRALTLDEKIERGLIVFGEDLLAYLPPVELSAPTEADELPPLSDDYLQLVQLGLDKKLINHRADCELALLMMDEELQSRVSQKYPMGVELKRVKQCLDWVLAGQPADDPRQRQYQQMNDDIAAIKAQYKATRGEIKQRLDALSGS